MNSKIKKLQKALEAGYEESSPGKLIGGAPLIIEDLAVPKGLYRKSERDMNFKCDYVRYGMNWYGEPLYYRKSEDFIKVYDCSKLVLHKDLIKKDDK
jgi:hypothetical protein